MSRHANGVVNVDIAWEQARLLEAGGVLWRWVCIDSKRNTHLLTACPKVDLMRLAPLVERLSIIVQSPTQHRLGSLRSVQLLVLFLTVPMAYAEDLFPLSADMAASYGRIGPAGYLDCGDGPLALDGITMHPAQPPNSTKVLKPKYAILAAELDNWDADLEPDGWRCQVQLRDQFDGPARPAAAYAAFELRLRVPRRDRNGFTDLRTESIRWSQKLSINDFGIADVKLPLRAPLPSFYVDGAGATQLARWQNPASNQQLGRDARFRSGGLSGGWSADNSLPLARPAWGVMVVRVSIPSVGVLEAIDPVLAEEPLLVDSNWPQR